MKIPSSSILKNSFKLTLSAILTTSLLASSVAYAAGSANIGVTSDYVFRGVTQTDNKAAISGGLDYDFGNGFSIGTWASNVELSPSNNSYEVDVYAGYGNKIGAFDYSVGVITYIYPDDDDIDFTEITGGLGYGPVSFNVAYTVDEDKNSASLEDNIYYSLSASTDVTPGFTVGGTIGYNDNDKDSNADYTHYQLSLSKGDLTAAVEMNDNLQNKNDPIISLSWVHTFDF